VRRLAAIVAVAALAGSTLGVAAQQPKPAANPAGDVPVFAPARAAQTVVAATETPTPNQTTPVPFGGLGYVLDPACLDQLYVTSRQTEQDPATGADVDYVKALAFLKAGPSDWIVLPLPENVASGALAKAQVGDRLCVGVEGVQ
jgi:hypothetical protein